MDEDKKTLKWEDLKNNEVDILGLENNLEWSLIILIDIKRLIFAHGYELALDIFPIIKTEIENILEIEEEDIDNKFVLKFSNVNEAIEKSIEIRDKISAENLNREYQIFIKGIFIDLELNKTDYDTILDLNFNNFLFIPIYCFSNVSLFYKTLFSEHYVQPFEINNDKGHIICANLPSNHKLKNNIDYISGNLTLIIHKDKSNYLDELPEENCLKTDKLLFSTKINNYHFIFLRNSRKNNRIYDYFNKKEGYGIVTFCNEAALLNGKFIDDTYSKNKLIIKNLKLNNNEIAFSSSFYNKYKNNLLGNKIRKIKSIFKEEYYVLNYVEKEEIIEEEVLLLLKPTVNEEAISIEDKFNLLIERINNLENQIKIITA